jgi:hypothetical protein
MLSRRGDGCRGLMGGEHHRGLQHIMHPDLREPAFMDIYGDQQFLEVCKALLGCDSDCLQLGEWLRPPASSRICSSDLNKSPNVHRALQPAHQP